MPPLLSSNSYAFHPPSAKGGLVQVISHRGTSRTEAALRASLRSCRPQQDYFFWAADEGVLYPQTLHEEWEIPLSRLLLVKARDAPEVWRLGLEAVQTGLFHSVFLRASRPCQTAHLRKLQLVAEKMRCEVFLLTPGPLPHWTLRETIEVGKNANPLHPKSKAPAGFRGKLFQPHAQSLPVQPL